MWISRGHDLLIKWIPSFCDKVRDMAEMDFYQEIAVITKKFLDFELSGRSEPMPDNSASSKVSS